MSRAALPVDALLPDLAAALHTSSCVVVEAAPGAGKTTRIPAFIAELRAAQAGQVVVTEPRRIAARLAAHFVAEELGDSVGNHIGYSVRFEERVSAKTRVRYVTEGVLIRQWLEDPKLRGAHTVIIDEFHERHTQTDQLLFICKQLIELRPEFRLVVMSATLDAEPLAKYLGNCPRLRSEGKNYPLRVEYSEPDDRPLEKQVLSALRRAASEVPDGNVLVFLPGSSEIRKCQTALSQSPLGAECDIVVLHGEQPIAEQAQAVKRGSRRRVVLSTNVAESSVTVEGVHCVIDSGLARVASHSVWTGASALRLERVSQSSAIQRAGRAARLGPGVVYRLYTQADYQARAAQQTPEVERSELSSLILECRGAGLPITERPWLTPLPSHAVEQALALLKDLSALTPAGVISALGNRLLALPLPVRLARVLLAGEALGVGRDTALFVALLAERDIHDHRAQHVDLPTNASDLQDRADRYFEAEASRFAAHSLRQLNLDAGRVRDMKSVYERLRRLVQDNSGGMNLERREELVRRAFLAGFSDRVARRKSPGQADLVLTTGGSARLSDLSVVRTEPFVLVLDMEERSADGRRSLPVVRFASGISPDWLLEDLSERVSVSDDWVYAPERERVETIGRMALGSVTIDETRRPALPGPQTAEVLYRAVENRLTLLLGKDSATETLRCRLQLLAQSGRDKSLPPLDQFSDRELLRQACQNATCLDDLKKLDLEQILLASLGHETRALLQRECPENFQIPGARLLKVHYEPGKPPWIASRLQDFFGMKQAPQILGGRVALTVHLLAPNQRAVQVTSDLPGFWLRHYPEIRKELMRKYPRHAWPEDGASAQPSAPIPRKSR